MTTLQTASGSEEPTATTAFEGSSIVHKPAVPAQSVTKHMGLARILVPEPEAGKDWPIATAQARILG